MNGLLRASKKIISTGLKFGIAAGLIFFLATTFAPRAILSVFTNDAAVIEEGLRYLAVMRWTYLIFAASNSLMYALQSVETVVIGTVMSISTIIINLCLNYCFIYGNLGAPELGIRGAAIATLTSRSVELVIILVYVLFIDKKLRMKVRDLLSFDSTFLKDYIKVSTPVVISGMMWGIGQAAQTAIMGHIGAGVIAANSIATTFQKLFVVFGFACTNVASVMTAKTIGAGKLHLIRSYSKTMQGIFICLGVVIGSVLFILRGSIVQFYNVSEDTKQLAVAFLTVLCVSTLGTCYEFPVESGIISGGGNTRYAPIVDNLFIWLFTIPFSALSAFVFHFPPVVTYCFLKADQLLKCIPNSITVNRYRWVHILTRDTAERAQN